LQREMKNPSRVNVFFFFHIITPIA
jgi:hypothetical protein